MKTLSEKLQEKVNAAYAKGLVGRMQFSDEEYGELVDYTGWHAKDLIRYIGSYLHGDDKIHFVTLVEIAKRWKGSDETLANDSAYWEKDAGYWENVYGVLSLEYIGTQKVYKGLIDSIQAASSPLPTIKKKYYAAVMMHALAPYSSMFSFFELIYFTIAKA